MNKPAMSLPADQVNALKLFVGMCKKNPAILHDPNLGFYRDYLTGLGATIPPPPAKEEPKSAPAEESKPSPEPAAKNDPPPAAAAESSSESSDVESDVEINSEFVIDPESEELPTLPSIDKEVTEEDSDKANEKRGEAMMSMSDGDMEAALAAFTEAIELNPHMAVLYAKRAQLLVRMKRPQAAIQDCNRALELNSNSALAYKQRGRANRLLGKIEEAYKDLGRGQQVDYDDDTDELQKSLKEDVHKLQAHENKRAHKKDERELKRRKKEAARRKAAAQKAYEEEQSQRSAGYGGMPGGFPGGMPGGFPGGMPGGFRGGMPGGMGGGMPGGSGGAGGAGGMPADLGNILSDPELLAAFQDPEISTAFMEVSQNPENINKYKSNPKVMKVIEKLQSKFGGASAAAEEPTSEPAGSAGSTGSAGGSTGSAGGPTGSAGPSGPSESSNDLD